MDERLWGDLREELVDRVLARLPIDSFFRLRAVCKRWNAIIHSHSFISDCSQVSTPFPVTFSAYFDVIFSMQSSCT